MVPGLFIAGYILGATALTCGALAGWEVASVRMRWRAAARALKLPLRFPFGGVPRIEGDHMGIAVSVTGDILHGALASVSTAAGIHVGPARANRRPGEGTGDAAFDQSVTVDAEGREEWVAARLDRDTRDQLRFFVRQGGTVNLGLAEIRAGFPERKRTLELAAARAMRVSWLLTEALDVPACLATNAREDPEFQVRERCLALLCERYPGPDAEAACRDALLDPDPGVRLVAAVFLREEGLPYLNKLVTDAAVPETIAAKAIAHAAAIHSPQTEAQVLDTLELGFQGVPLLHAQAIHSAAKIGWWEGVASRLAILGELPPLAKVALAGAVPRFLERIHEWEPVLISLLTDPDPGVRRAAIETLGDFGSIAAVEPLLPMVQSLLDGEVRRLAANAVRQIQGRQVGAGAGQLSLDPDAANETQGLLALASEGGELALSRDAGALALSAAAPAVAAGEDTPPLPVRTPAAPNARGTVGARTQAARSAAPAPRSVLEEEMRVIPSQMETPPRGTRVLNARKASEEVTPPLGVPLPASAKKTPAGG